MVEMSSDTHIYQGSELGLTALSLLHEP
jgi:hypothetical protein